MQFHSQNVNIILRGLSETDTAVLNGTTGVLWLILVGTRLLSIRETRMASKNSVKQDSLLPICSMYGIFAYIYHKFVPNVGRYSIHGAYELCN